ncbi:energy transducer TonB [Rhodobacteraceae bacterium M382]|nr:energy transducer TonB [Rhodobacteraceae bacterium M382]
MQTGSKISVAIHLGLVGWALFGGTFDSEPLPFDVQEVAVISAQEFEALSARPATPELSNDPAALVQPTPVPDAPTPDPVEDVAPVVKPPEPTAPPVAEQTPPTPQLPDPLPEPDVADTTSVIASLPEPTPEPEPLAPLVAKRPKTRPADRVAPVPVAPPPPEAVPDPVQQPEIAATEGADAEREVQEATAPEEASDRIETEANREEETQTAALAPARSLRPPSNRPERPTERPAQPAQRDAVADALAEALTGAQTSPQTDATEQADIPTGPPLSAGEKDALRVAVSSCWNVGSLSSEALNTTVVLAVSMSQQGKPDVGSIRMLSSEGGSAAAAKQAYEAARRAVIRCGAKGYNLPADKYAQWRDIEMTFNPERMRIK